MAGMQEVHGRLPAFLSVYNGKEYDRDYKIKWAKSTNQSQPD